MSKKRTKKAKACEVCHQEHDELFRIRVGEQPWFFACQPCMRKAKESEGYQYGGTWKRHKRH